MKKLLFSFLLLLAPCFVFAGQYIFFLHNMFVELYPLDAVHPEYGKCEYNEILDAYRKKGFTVISEIRSKNTDGKVYAGKVVKQIDSLLKKGVKPSDITVIGTSKGGFIAQNVSAQLKNKDVNFVFIGCCEADVKNNPTLPYYGNILSIYEQSDTWHTCKPLIDASGKNVKQFKEIELNTGLKHGFLYKPLPEWIEPSAKWAKGDHK